MKRVLILLTMLGFGVAAQSQTHFVTAYSGNPYLAMNIYITEATMDGAAIEIGDEIGIFDGDICVGAAVVNSAFSPSSPLAMVASTEDPTTTETDGFVAGNTIQFRLWDESEQVEYPDVTATFSLGDGTFSSQGSAMASLSAVGNQPPVLSDIEDVTFPEDTEMKIGLSASDPDAEDVVSFDAWTDESSLALSVTDTDSLTLTPDQDWYGSALVYVEASDGSAADTVSFTTTVSPVNDAPAILNPMPDLMLDEDALPTLLADLDTVFTDVDLEELTYTVTSDTSAVTGEIDSENLLTVSVAADWNGEAELIISAEDNSGALAEDNVQVTVSPINDAPVVSNAIPDITLAEDAADTTIADLDTVFLDVDNENLSFTAETNDVHFSVTIDDENVCVLSVTPDWHGTGSVYLAAADNEFTAHDTIDVTVMPVNDPPSAPVALYPMEQVELDTNGALVWSISQDLDVGDEVTYEIEIDAPTNSGRQAFTGAALSTVFSTVVTQDTAIVFPLQDLSDYENLLDDLWYNWRVRAVDSQDTPSDWSDYGEFFFNKMNTTPNPPNTGFNPQDSVTVSSLYPSFSWNAAIDPDFSDGAESLQYELIVGDDWGFPDTLYQYTTDPGQTSITWEIGPVEDNSVLFYQVRTIDDEGLVSEWSQFKIFFINTALDPPEEFLVLSPTGGDSVAGDSTSEFTEVTFTWNASSDPDLNDQVVYYVALDTSGGVEEITSWEDLQAFTVVWETGTDTSYSALLDTGYYRWAVIAADTDSLWRVGVNADGDSLHEFILYSPTVGIHDDLGIVEEYRLLQNYPNPFNPTTQIRYALPNSGHVTVNVYDVQGRRITTLVNAEQSAGWHTIEWAGKNALGQQVSTGVYFYSIQVGAFSDLRKMVLVK